MKVSGLVWSGLALIVALPAIVVLVLGEGAAPQADAEPGQGLRPGSVPAAYVALVLAAGSVCVAAPSAIVAAQIQQESGWNPRAVSPVGAQGISQFMPGTWPLWSRRGESPFDPAAAIPAQGRYDCALATEMGVAQQEGRVSASLTLTQLMLAAYNAGPAAVLAAGGIPQNGQTPGYVANIVAGAAKYAGTTGVISGSGFAAREIAAAQSQIGVPYAWDGGSYTGPTRGVCAGGGAENDCNITGFDCSGLTMFAAYQASGGKIQLSHSAAQQSDGGTRVQPADIEPGDLIAFSDPGSSVPHHVGVYIGGGQMIDAPESGTLVRIDSLDSAYYRSQQWTVVRYG